MITCTKVNIHQFHILEDVFLSDVARISCGHLVPPSLLSPLTLLPPPIPPPPPSHRWVTLCCIPRGSLSHGARKSLGNTGRLDRMSHRKWWETKQQQSRARLGHQISCCLVSLHFLCEILSSHPVLPSHLAAFMLFQVSAQTTKMWKSRKKTSF